MILVFHHCGQFIISNMEFLFYWVTNLYICIAQLENTPIKSYYDIHTHDLISVSSPLHYKIKIIYNT